MIALTYINKKSATIEAMKDYENMKHIIAVTSQEVKDEYDAIINVSSAKITGMPKTNNPKAGENKMVQGIDKINIMQERYRQAMEYMDWFDPSWKMLSEEEQFILREFYTQGNLKSGATARISIKYNYSPRHIERLKYKALERLMFNLYGR